MPQIVLDQQDFEWLLARRPPVLAGRQFQARLTFGKELRAPYRYGRRRFHPHFDLIPAYPENRDSDVRSNMDRTIPLARQNQHGHSSVTIDPETSRGALSGFILQLREATAELLLDLRSGSPAIRLWKLVSLLRIPPNSEAG
jgi:hypothetical protein